MSNQIKLQLIDPAFKVKGELVESNGLVYNCNLNQTEIDANKNKFYIMQLIKTGSEYKLCVRYGRLGEPGKALTTAQGSEVAGKAAFEKQFKAKTGNVWGTKDFKKKPGKYFMSEVSYDDELSKVDLPKQVKMIESKLPERTQKLLSMLTDVKIMQQALISLEIDTKKLPIGKIKHSQLENANKMLVQIGENIKKIDAPKMKAEDKAIIKSDLIQKSSEFYTLLPMSFGRRKPPVINSDEMISKYQDTIDELKNMVVNVQLTENVKSGDNPIDSIYNGLDTTIKPLEHASQMWKHIENYVKNTHGPTHRYKLEILDIFEVQQNFKQTKFDNCCKNIDNRTLLYHGSGMTNWVSILKNDLLLNPHAINKNVIITGKMFSNGIYFADAITKSFGYARPEASGDIGCLALAEVALGNTSRRTQADYYITKDSLAKTGNHSTHGVGKWQPGNNINHNGIIIPNGKLVDTKTSTALLYNEFIVYDSNQQFIRYLVIVKNIA